MKITKYGTPPSEKKWEGKCYSCGSEAVATQSEMTHIQHDQREGGSFSWEVCPVCQAGDPDSGYGGMLFMSNIKWKWINFGDLQPGMHIWCASKWRVLKSIDSDGILYHFDFEDGYSDAFQNYDGNNQMRVEEI